MTAAASSDGWVGGWRNPGLRRPGRPSQPLEPPPRPSPIWSRRPTPRIFDEDGHEVRADGTRVEACRVCGFLTGAAWRLVDGVKVQIRPRVKKPCKKKGHR